MIPQNKTQWLIVVAFLAAVSSTLSLNAQNLIKQGKVRPTDSELFVRKNVGSGGTGTQNLLEGLANSEIGISNFDGQRLDADRYFVISELTLNYGVGLIADAVHAIDYSVSFPLALKTANLVIKQDNEVLHRIPVASINEAKSTDNRYRDLGGFVLLRDQKTIRVELEFAAGADLVPGAGNAGFVEVLLKGFETVITR